MPEPVDSRVAVYIDFDNIVISRYAQVHPANRRDQLSTFTDDALMKARLNDATVDIGAILDYASSFGTIVISRAYADWSLPVNAAYQRQLISRAVDLTQIAGDSDYISLAQRAKRLDRYVVGIGVAGSVSSSLADACSEFADYDDLPGVDRPKVVVTQIPDPVEKSATVKKAAPATTTDRDLQSLRDKAAALLKKALELVEADEEGWRNSSPVKQQMKRIDPKFSEKALGFTTFMDFVESRPKLVEVKKEGLGRKLRLR
jgi:hypothetical protein